MRTSRPGEDDPSPARQRLATALGGLVLPGSFSARRTGPVDDLVLDVRGVGRIELPVPPAQARQLAELGRPARYGRGEQTLLDRTVRDTSEIPIDRVRIDQQRFDATLVPLLDRLRADLGLPSTCRLIAKLHSLLVYGPGQFFVPHQDSEKADHMVGSLVVTLPSTFAGGSLVVAHGGERATYRTSKTALTLVAFYADCRHEVRSVTSGHRITLTFNLMMHGDPTPADAPRETVRASAALLEEHFTVPPPVPGWLRDSSDAAPPNRLLYLLDHSYTARGLGWPRLKGHDAVRAAVLRAAAADADCEIVLALADVHETWSCEEREWAGGWGRHGRSRAWDEDEDDWPGHDDPADHDDEIDELIDSSVTLERWIPPGAEEVESVSTSFADDEVCASTASADLRPYASEHEGYMGNYGNTLDRWYHRGALVVWPRNKAFAVRAEASPSWALATLTNRARTDAAEARELAATLTSTWRAAVGPTPGRGLLGKALRVARALDEPALATMLLAPFHLELLKPPNARALTALVDTYGGGWARDTITAWSRPRGHRTAAGGDRASWIATLPRLCAALEVADADAGTTVGRLLVEDAWQWVRARLETSSRLDSPTRRDDALDQLAGPLLAVLESMAVAGDKALRDDAVAVLTEAGDALLGCLVPLLRAAEGLPPHVRAAAGLDALALHCTRRLQARLAHPPRPAGDWSIDLPDGCGCELCDMLGAFLADPTRQTLEWPINKERRHHVHIRLDRAELPVRHQTRRKGRPYTLVLTKTEELFDQEARARRRDELDLAWLTRTRD